MYTVRRKPRLLAFVAMFLTAAVSARAQAPVGEPVVPEKIGKDLHAYHVVGTVPRIDGLLDDEAWTRAAAADDFIQNEPDNMAAPVDRTVMQFAYDGRTLYVAIRCLVSAPETLTTGLGRRDSLPPSDLLRLSFDPRHDHLNAYVFETNPSGMQSDYIFYDDTRQSSDYDAVWEVKTRVDDNGWTAEYAIPFSQMRFAAPLNGPMVWGLNLRRDNYVAGGFDRWVPTPRGAQGFVSRFGHLIFDDGLETPRRMELLPVLLGRVETPSGGGTDLGAEAGLDMRFGLGSGATLSATVNPDFGQVEQDPSVLNLTVFETFYPEKRPFFLEDSRTFVPPYNQMIMFHSRRIGRVPRRFGLQTGDVLVSQPDATTILGASKLTGKSGGWTYGGLTALTAAEYAVVEHVETDGEGHAVSTRLERLIEPRTLYNVGRLQREFSRGSKSIGAIGTATVRDNDVDAYTGSVDYNLRWDSNRGQWNGQAAGTHAPFGTVLRNGFGYVTNAAYNRKNANVNGHYDYFSPSFRNSDLGFLSTRINKSAANLSVNVGQPDPYGVLRNIWGYANYGGSWSTDGLLLQHRLFGGVSANLRNFWGGYLEGERLAEVYDDLDSRGGPPIVKQRLWNVFSGFHSDSRKTWTLNFNAWGGRIADNGWNGGINETLRLKPTAHLQTSLGVEIQRGVDPAQWIVNTDTNGDGVVDNVYGRLSRDVVSITGRSTYAFSRDMTLEAYLQPFVAVGAYANVRRLARPMSYDFLPAQLPNNPDFNTKSLNCNLVFRWEYVKGSALFVVWNRTASDAARPGAFAPARDIGTAFGADGTNVFLVKWNYWLGL